MLCRFVFLLVLFVSSIGFAEFKAGSIEASGYDVNLVFVNKEPRTSQDADYPFGVGTTREEKMQDVKRRLVDKAVLWAATNRNSQVTIWLDFGFLDQGIIDRTKVLLTESANAVEAGLIDRIAIKNLRELPLVSENKDVFDGKVIDTTGKELTIFVYWRADLARAIVTDYLLEHNPKRLVVYADLDIIPVNLEEKIRNNANLQEFGYVMAKSPKADYENSFFIFGADPAVKRAHYGIIIFNTIRNFRDPTTSSERRHENNYVYNRYQNIPVAVQRFKNPNYIHVYDEYGLPPQVPLFEEMEGTSAKREEF